MVMVNLLLQRQLLEQKQKAKRQQPALVQSSQLRPLSTSTVSRSANRTVIGTNFD